ncbi:hypothetical protein AHIS2_p019 [Acaryochloris phage A-HIS2]|nr:hypothetical protein AHIS2_p019 [Acaryochloris phage A-HIS2]
MSRKTHSKTVKALRMLTFNPLLTIGLLKGIQRTYHLGEIHMLFETIEYAAYEVYSTLSGERVYTGSFEECWLYTWNNPDTDFRQCELLTVDGIVDDGLQRLTVLTLTGKH